MGREGGGHYYTVDNHIFSNLYHFDIITHERKKSECEKLDGEKYNYDGNNIIVVKISSREYAWSFRRLPGR